MTNEELLQMYINKVDQEQVALRQEQAAQRQEMIALRQDLKDQAVQTDRRLIRMERTIQTMSADVRREFREQKRFIIGTILAAAAAVAAVVALLMPR